MKLLYDLTQLFKSDFSLHIEKDMNLWRKNISNAVFTYFTFFGLFSYIPSVILSIKEKVYGIAAASTIAYLLCIFITFNRRINHTLRSILGIGLFYILGVILLLMLGPLGAGTIWIFATTILAAYLLGNRGAGITFVLQSLLLLGIWFMLKKGMLNWEAKYNMYPEAWLIKSVNYIMLNFVFVIANALFIKGFKSLVSRSFETRDASIIGLAKLAEYRDNDTGQHLLRMKNYVTLLCGELRKNPRYNDYIDDDYLRDIQISVILHDIGKVGVPDAILLKPGALTDEEFEIIKRHPRQGAEVISEIEKQIHGQSLYSLGKEIALYHHEQWDGSGYPEGLRGDRIPLSARITALIDVYDALITKRCYKTPMTHKEALEIIRKKKGTQFDPEIVDAFLQVSDEIKKLNLN